MNLFNQPLRAYARTTVLVVLCSVVPQLATAQGAQPRIRELARKEAIRMVAADSKAATVPRPPNYPQAFLPSMPTTKAGRRAAAVTLGALGGLVAGAVIATRVGCIHGTEDCAIAGLMVGAPIGAVAGGVTVALLTR